LEQAGIATTLIALVRDNAERCKPPRALWTPFELGRPLGPPNDPAFQRKVLMTALDLLTREDGPVILEDYPDDDPNAVADPNWINPVDLAGAETLEAEVAAVAKAHDAIVAKTGRSVFGLTGMSVTDTVNHINAIADGDKPEGPLADFSPMLTFRFAVDDLKALYLQAASAGGNPSSKQLVEWFWDQTIAGRTLVELRAKYQNSESNSEKRIGGNMLVPGAQVFRKGLKAPG
jgi:hypothetical protein